MKYATRGNALGFAHRTRKNLEHIETAFSAGSDVHVITQLVNSLLGLIVFPLEKHFVDSIKTKELVDLQAQGWPEWKIMYGKSNTLGDLITNLRHSVAHGNIQFSSDSRNIDEVYIEAETYKPKEYTELKWSARILAKDLHTFCIRFFNLIEETIG